MGELGARRGVFHGPSRGIDLRADGVGCGEIFRLFRLGSFLRQLHDLRRDVLFRSFGGGQGGIDVQERQHAVEVAVLVEQNRCGVMARALCEQTVDFLRELVNRGERLGDVKIVGEPVRKLLPCGFCGGLCIGEERVPGGAVTFPEI